jgi:hypothetical protein
LKDAPAACSLENALKGIFCKKGSNARARAFEEKKVCLLSRLPEDRYKRTFKRVQTHNGGPFGGPFFVFQHLLHKHSEI